MSNRLILFFILGIFILSGCAAISKKDKEMGTTALLEPQAISKFADVPVPAGFALKLTDSYSFENVGVRVCMLKYQGKANIEQVLNFYKEQMPMYKWNLLNIVEYGERLLNFDRESETCIISLLPKGKNILITISIGPKSQALPKKAGKPIK